MAYALRGAKGLQMSNKRPTALKEADKVGLKKWRLPGRHS